MPAESKSQSTQKSSAAHHWGYSRPDDWCRQFPVGSRQSPIDIQVNECELLAHQGTCCRINGPEEEEVANNNNHHHQQRIYLEKKSHLLAVGRRNHLNSAGENFGDEYHERSSSTCSDSTAGSASPLQFFDSSPANSPEPLVPERNHHHNHHNNHHHHNHHHNHDHRREQPRHHHSHQVQRAAAAKDADSSTRYCTTNRKLFLGYPRYLNELQLNNTGHSWQVNLAPELASHTLLSGPPLADREYRLAQLHCHWGQDEQHGSEHLINGKAYSAEIHFVHWNCTDFDSMEEASKHRHGLAVLAVMVQALEGEHNRNKHLDRIANSLDYIQEPGSSVKFKARLDLKKLFPANRWLYASYEGSLTTPPLSEVVDWIVFLNPIHCSSKQIEQFRCIRCHSEGSSSSGPESHENLVHNCRPVQPLNNRIVSIWSHH